MHELQPRLLARAMEIAGGRGELVSLLNVEDHAFGLWLAGRATLPDRVFRALVDLILEDDIARAAQDRRAMPRCQLTPIDTRV